MDKDNKVVEEVVVPSVVEELLEDIIMVMELVEVVVMD